MILRHDIDTDIEKAYRMAELEKNLNVSSTYFVLITSNFYNVFSYENKKFLKSILECGHEIGLHFDEKRYPEICGNEQICIDRIMKEKLLLELMLDVPITKVSYHRPSKDILDSYIEIPGMINSYGKKFFDEYKYLSDSRRRWREPVEEIVESGNYSHLHILTHAFWYQDIEESISDTVKKFVKKAQNDRYMALKDNITDLSSIMSEEELQ